MLLIRQSVHAEHDIFGARGPNCSQFDARLYSVNESDHIGRVIAADNFDRAASHLCKIALECLGSRILVHALADDVIVAAHARHMGSEEPSPNLKRDSMDIRAYVIAPPSTC